MNTYIKTARQALHIFAKTLKDSFISPALWPDTFHDPAVFDVFPGPWMRLFHETLIFFRAGWTEL